MRDKTYVTLMFKNNNSGYFRIIQTADGLIDFLHISDSNQKKCIDALERCGRYVELDSDNEVALIVADGYNISVALHSLPQFNKKESK